MLIAAPAASAMADQYALAGRRQIRDSLAGLLIECHVPTGTRKIMSAPECRCSSSLRRAFRGPP